MPPPEPFVAELVSRLLDTREAIIRQLVASTLSEIAELNHDPGTARLLEASISENIVLGVNFLARDLPVEQAEAPTSALAYARTLAQQQVPLSALTRAYRIGHARFLDAAFELLTEIPVEGRTALVTEVVRRTSLWLDAVTMQVSRAYEAEREQWLVGDDAARRRVLTEVLEGRTVDEGHVARMLRYRLSANHVAALAWPGEGVAPAEAVRGIEEVADGLAQVLGATARLAVPLDVGTVALWFAVPPGPAHPGPAHPGPAHPDPGPSGRRSTVRLAFGRPEPGGDGFRRSHRQAARVRDVLVAAAPRAGAAEWAGYDDLAPLALMTGDLDALRAFVLDRLGDLARDDRRSATLRHTLRIYLDHRRSASATATALMMHRNSVQYRVEQAAAQLPGGRLGEGPDHDVSSALIAAHWLGATVLRG